ncbi:MAG TPA: YbaK/EbsC family protein [Anaerolineales bacterium]|nr:YbaK/EbsC family protein [Anaerolineales bacterium]
MTEPIPVSVALTKLNIPHHVFTHQGQVRSIEQAAAERNQEVSQVVRSILFRLNQGEYAMVLIAGKQQISWKALRQHFGMSRLTMASPEEVFEVTGHQIGTVSPFGLKTPVPILADQNVFTQTAVSLGSGKAGVAIMMLTKDLKNALDGIVIGQFAQF